MSRFRYWTSAPFFPGGVACHTNRRWLTPRVEGRVLRSHFNDPWMIPGHLLFWTLISKGIGALAACLWWRQTETAS